MGTQWNTAADAADYKGIVEIKFFIKTDTHRKSVCLFLLRYIIMYLLQSKTIEKGDL